MLKEERFKKILNEVALHNRVLMTDLATNLDVSVDTIRRDIKELDALGSLKKVHGGAISVAFSSLSPSRNKIYALLEKTTIAQKATSLLKNDAVIFIDGGTSCLELARQIPVHLSLTVFTISLSVALELQNKPKIQTIVVGGNLSRETNICLGSAVVRQMKDIRVDLGFIGTGYVDPHAGLTEFDYEIVELKKALLGSFKKVALLCISEKLHSNHRYTTCSINEIDFMVTELHPDDDLLKSFKTMGVQII